MSTIDTSFPVNWGETKKALEEYAGESGVWLRREVSGNEEYLVAHKVTFGMRFLAFFGIRWKLPDVVDFVQRHVQELPQHTDTSKLYSKLDHAVEHYNSRCLLPFFKVSQTQTEAIKELARKVLFVPSGIIKAAPDKAKPLIAKAYPWVLNVGKTQDVTKAVESLRSDLQNASTPKQEPFITLKHIVKRYDQLGELDIEKKPLTPAERLKLAVYIEMTLPKVIDGAKIPFAHASKQLPREVLITKKREIVVMAEAGKSKLKASGTFKQVYNAAMVPLKRKEKPIELVQAQISPEEDEMEQTEQELALFKEVKGLPGFVRMHTFRKISPNKKVSKFRVVFEKFDGNLTKIPDLSFQQKVDVARQLIQAMKALYDKNILHLDFKSENVLYKMQDGRPIIGVTDFGLSLKVPDKGKIDLSEHIISKGTYGTCIATAPELIATKIPKATKEQLEKLDSWALGVVLYTLVNGKVPPWYDTLDIEGDFTKKHKQTVEKQVKEHIEEPLKALLQKKHLTPEDKMQLLIFQLQRLNPKDRYNMRQAFAALNAKEP